MIGLRSAQRFIDWAIKNPNDMLAFVVEGDAVGEGDCDAGARSGLIVTGRGGQSQCTPAALRYQE